MKSAKKIRHVLNTTIITTLLWLTSTAYATPINSEGATKGAFGPVVSWPVLPIHWSLLPDGRVLSYGARQGVGQAGLVHDVWDPALGTDPSTHNTAQNGVDTNIFCTGLALISATGETLITGGTTEINGVDNNGTSDANFFNPQTNKMRPAGSMAFRRWYPTVLGLANGNEAILGGKDDALSANARAIPELFVPGVGFKSLTNAFNDEAYGNNETAWYYPRAFLAPIGKVFIVNHAGQSYWLDTAGAGNISQIPGIQAPTGSPSLSSVMYWPGKVFSIRSGKQVALFDARTSNVTMKVIPGLSHNRILASTTLMADGRVFIHGGSDVYNQLTGVAHQAEIWNPNTETFSLAANNDSNVARLYHSNALLLQDGTILTGGGGDPGPQRNLNAEIYYPSYLYKKDGSGTPADRPIITNAPSQLTWGETFNLSYNSAKPITRITLVRAGSATHTLNVEQRFNLLSFTQAGANTLNVTGPRFKTTSPPGYYMVFIFDQSGVPSIAKIIHVN